MSIFGRRGQDFPPRSGQARCRSRLNRNYCQRKTTEVPLHATGSPGRVLARIRVGVLLLLSAMALAAVASCGPSQTGETSESAPPTFRPFAPDSPFLTELSDSAPVDPGSPAMVARMSRDNALYSNLIDFAIPIYHVNDTTPRYSVRCTMDWGSCPFDKYWVPIPTDAEPSPGSDGAMVVVDESTREIFEFWQARNAGDHWTTSWGAIGDLDGDGWEEHGHSTGSGASRLAGVILVSEIQQGEIPHALALQSDNVCADVFRSPATRTDGTSTRSDCIPEGARVRLDPRVDLDSLELTPAVRMVARAMQTYGGYVMDVGAAPLSVSFERDTTAAAGSIGRTYQDAGLQWDYDNLPGVPWDRLQVLA